MEDINTTIALSTSCNAVVSSTSHMPRANSVGMMTTVQQGIATLTFQ